MPTYEYECKKCAHVFEAFQSMSAEHLTECPECKGPLRRLIGTGAGLLFKGSGFYTTDYRSDSYHKSAKADKPESTSDKKTSSDKKSTASSGSKPKKEG